jgi:site-specific DNA-cytosine methylase
MGWDDERIDVAFSSGSSETQLYKMAGNSIVVNVLTRIFEAMKFFDI